MTETINILLVEDDLKLASLLKDYFDALGFFVTIAESGARCRQLIEDCPQLVILDLNLPDVDGLTICRELKQSYSGKILMLTASGDDMDQVAALEIGADDFVQKPVQPRVLLARIRNLVRQQQESKKQQDTHQTKLTFGALELNNTLKRCALDGEMINLTPSEFSLLWQLASNANNAVSRDALLKEMRNIDYDGLDRTIDNKVARLRKKLGDKVTPYSRIITVRSKGYVFVSDAW